MIKLKEAVDLAKNFLSTSAGVATLFTNLESVSEKNGRWVVAFKYTTALLPSTTYTVELDKDSGEVLQYAKSD